MTLLKVYHSAWVFKFIYDTGYLYMVDTCVMGITNSILVEYVKVPKGYNHETIKNI